MGLERRPLPSTGVTRLPRYYEPHRRPRWPGLSLAGVRLRVTRPHRLGFPVLRWISMYRHAVVITPVAHWVGLLVGRSIPTVSLLASGFGLPQASARSAPTLDVSRPARRSLRVTACLLAASPKRHICLEGSGGFVTSAAAPIATGRSNPVAGWELHPLKINTFSRRTLAASRFRFLLEGGRRPRPGPGHRAMKGRTVAMPPSGRRRVKANPRG
jgi:hypothetical protein